MSPPSANPSTRERILDSAEGLFADCGIGATTLRALTRRAGVNLAAVHYHFGSKDGLLDAVVARLADPINHDRHAALDRLLEMPGPAPDAAAVLRAYFEPVIDRLEAFEADGRTPTLARLLARIEAQPREQIDRLAERHFGAIARRYVEALTRALPRLEPAVVAERFLLATSVLTTLFSDAGRGVLESQDESFGPSRGVGDRAREALAFAEAGLCAPSTRPTTAAPEPDAPSVAPDPTLGCSLESPNP